MPLRQVSRMRTALSALLGGVAAFGLVYGTWMLLGPRIGAPPLPKTTPFLVVFWVVNLPAQYFFMRWFFGREERKYRADLAARSRAVGRLVTPKDRSA